MFKACPIADLKVVPKDPQISLQKCIIRQNGCPIWEYLGVNKKKLLNILT